MPFILEGEYVNDQNTGIVMGYYTKVDITFGNEFLNGHKAGENDAARYLIFKGKYANNGRD